MRRENSHHITMEELGRRLKAVREACGFERKDIANILGITDAVLERIEFGASTISTAELSKLAYLYGCSLMDFFAPDFQVESADLAVSSPYYQKPRDESHLEKLRQIAVLRRELDNLKRILRLKQDADYHFCREFLLSDNEDPAAGKKFRDSFSALANKAAREKKITKRKLEELLSIVSSFCDTSVG